MFSVTPDPARRLVRATLTGFFTVDEVAAFAAAEQAAARALGPGPFDLLVETPDGTAQAQDVAGAFRTLAETATVRATRIAVACESSLLRLQLRRILTGDTVAVFENRHDAESWLRGRIAA
jgi:hypothetical protein